MLTMHELTRVYRTDTVETTALDGINLEIADGEFNMGIIPSEAFEFVGSIGLREPLLNLANADFERTAALADKFDRSELRIEAKMLIVRTLLPTEKE